jgi:hypothetical protein
VLPAPANSFSKTEFYVIQETTTEKCVKLLIDNDYLQLFLSLNLIRIFFAEKFRTIFASCGRLNRVRWAPSGITSPTAAALTTVIR